MPHVDEALHVSDVNLRSFRHHQTHRLTHSRFRVHHPRKSMLYVASADSASDENLTDFESK